MRFAVVIAAAGKSVRFGGVKKEYKLLDGSPVLSYSIRTFLGIPDCAAVMVVVPADGEREAREVLGDALLTRAGPRLMFVEGGVERADSVKAGLLALRGVDPEYVLVHDAARPRVSLALIQRVLAESFRSGACVPGLPLSDTVKRVDADGTIREHLDRASLRSVQTPQGFQYRGLLSAYLSAGSQAASSTDDAQIWAKAGGTVVVIDGDRENTKITFPEDLP